MKQILFLFLLIKFTSISYGQSFLNGDFEINSVTACMINNMSNAQFDSLMNNTRGIGATETIDIFDDNDCSSYSYAQSGHYFVSVENNSSDSTQSTAISLQLADTLLAGNNYSFCFYDKGLSTGVGPVVIGVSNTDSTFGTEIYATPIFNTSWTLRSVSFNAPITARYVTVRYGGLIGGAIVDNFYICNGTGINDPDYDKPSFNIFPNPATSQLNIQTESNSQFHYFIYNSLGQLLLTGLIENNLNTLNTNSLANGIYCIEFSGDNKIERKRFIIEK